MHKLGWFIALGIILGPAAFMLPAENDVVQVVGAQTVPLWTEESADAILPACADHAEMADKLALGYREHPFMVGMLNEQTILEIFVSIHEKRTFTILTTTTDGTSCVHLTGEEMEIDPTVLKGDPT